MLLLLYRISDQQKQIIMNMGNNTNGGWEWKLSWRRALFDSEIQMADNFLGELSQQQIQPNTEDRCSWKHDQTGYYSTKSGYDLIWEAQMGANQNLDFVDIWKLKIPSKSLVFAWRLIRDRLPTRMNLRRRQWKLGDGNTIKFWKDKWREEDDLSLQEKYPTLFQNQNINSMGILSGSNWEWRIQWRRHFFDHEIDTLAAFMTDIEGIQIQPLTRDFLSWGADPAGYCSAKSAYNLLKAEASSNSEDNNYKTIWKLQIPPRASAFSWRIFKNRLPTRDNLRRRHVELPSYNCPLCDQEEETVGHIMYSCRKTCVLWWEILRWVNRMGPFPLQPNCHFLQFSQWSGNSKVDNRWKALWIALSMTIWKHRNALVFNNQNFCTEKVTASALFHTWSWINCMEKDFHTHFNQWSTCLKEEIKDSTNKRWEFLWLALSFSIWYHRNAKIFKNQPFTPEKVMDDALFHTWSWIKCVEKDFQMHFNFWSTNLKDVLS
ncbi:putative ribonuclease H protein [Glycine max]|nr:putative ribonuclease H protein [Glycine max]